MVHIKISKETHKKLMLIKVNNDLESLDEALRFVFNDYEIFVNISPLLNEIRASM